MSEARQNLPRADVAGVPRARQMLARARWAARAFATYDRASVLRIAEAVTRVAEDHAEHYARWTVEETGHGVVADKAVLNRLCSRGVLDAHLDRDLVTPRIDGAHEIVELPRPAGVVLALTPATNPVSAVYKHVVLSLLTRNAVVVVPHPFAARCCIDASRVLAVAAVAAGAPDGVVQVVEEPSAALIDAIRTDERVDIRTDERVDVVLTTDGANVPVLVDATADLPRAAAKLVASKAFDHSLPSTTESVLVVEDAVAEEMLREMARRGAHVLDPVERDLVRDALFPQGRFDDSLAGQDAVDIAARAGVRVDPGTRILVAPLDLAVDEEPLAHEKPCPVLGVTRVPTARRGFRTAAAVLRIGGGGRSAVIHSTDPRVVMDFAAAVDVDRVAVNEGGSWLRDDPQPEQLLRTARISHGRDDTEVVSRYEGVDPWSPPAGPVPPYPVAATTIPGSSGRGRR